MSQAEEITFDIDTLIKALKDDDADTIAKQAQVMPAATYNAHIPVDDAIGTAILDSDYKLAEQLAAMVVARSGASTASETLSLWANFIHVGMTDRYFNRRELLPLFRGLCEVVQDGKVDPWPCVSRASLFIKMARLGLGEPGLQFTEKGESLTYYVVTAKNSSIEDKVNILRYLEHNHKVDLSAHNGYPSPVIAAITKRYFRIWNRFFSRFKGVEHVHDENGNNILYYVLKYKLTVPVRNMWAGFIPIYVNMFCEKNKEGKAMIEYIAQNGEYPEWWFNYDTHPLSYSVIQKLVRDKEFEVLQILPPIPPRLIDRFSFLFSQHEIPNYNVAGHIHQYFVQKRKEKMMFVAGAESSFSFELLPTEILGVILTDLAPSDIVCLKLSAKSIALAVDRTAICQRLVLSHFPATLGTSDDSSKEFERQVRIDVNWKKFKPRVRKMDTQLTTAARVMDENWLFAGGYHKWLHNLRSGQTISIADSRNNECGHLCLLDSNPTTPPLAASIEGDHFKILNFGNLEKVETIYPRNLKAPFRFKNESTYGARYMRQLEGKQLLLGINGAVWSYEIDATIGHLITEDLTKSSAIKGADAKGSVIATATDTSVALWDHRTLARITDFNEGLKEHYAEWPNAQYNPKSRPVYLHENEVVFINRSGLFYYERRTNTLLEEVPFRTVNVPTSYYNPNHVFDVTGTRCVLTYGYSPASLMVIYNIKERGWEYASMLDSDPFAINSYAMCLRSLDLLLFD